MRVNSNYIKIILLAIVICSLYAFSNIKNRTTKPLEAKVEFLGENTLFVTEEAVSKLLIQNQLPVTELPKEIIDLNELETALNSNPMIKEAQVFMSVNGELSAEIEQKQPIARVSADSSFYIDDEGSYMPLSSNYSARVPLVTGQLTNESINKVYHLAKTINEDDFLKKHVIAIHQNDEGGLSFKIRRSDVIIELGDLSKLHKKLSNFKVFYQKAIKDSILNNYRTINLKFDKQVICTKK